MRIAIIGTGNVGSALAAGWSERGHEIVFGARDPDHPKVTALTSRLPGNASTASIAAAADGAEVVVLATPWGAVESVLQGTGDLTGKIVVDCTNPLTADLSGLTIGHDRSAGEQVANWAPSARVVKAFNTTGASNMADSGYAAARPWMPVCGDDDDAKRVVMELASELGFEAVDAGPLAGSRLIEPLALLWIQLAYAQGLGLDFALALLRR